LRATVKVFSFLLLTFFMISISTSTAKEVLIRVKKSGVVTATAYNSMESQCDSTPWITASGSRCREGVIAANFLPFGTKVLIEGFPNQIFVVEDRMNRRYRHRIDIWFRYYKDAIKFGRREIRYHILEEA
jgi:3D (Asp-Asp-Asp) domain-containing protein